jgi:hypothetical protein
VYRVLCDVTGMPFELSAQQRLKRARVTERWVK